MANDQIISQALIRLLQKFQFNADKINEEKDLPKIQVNTTISKIALAYEKIRNAIDYKEEHLLRKNAVERILKRHLLMTNVPAEIAKLLILELIRAGYLKNNEVGEFYIAKIEEILFNYLTVKNYLPKYYQNKSLGLLNNWFISLMAVEIEETIVTPAKQDALVELAYEQINNKMVFLDSKLTEETKAILLYLAIHKAINKSDPAILGYHLFRYFLPILPTEKETVAEEEILSLAANFAKLKEKVDSYLNHPLNRNILKSIKKITVPYLILNDFIEAHADSAYQKLSQKSYLEEFIRQDCKKRYKEAQKKLHRGAVRSIIYLFITKMALVLILEMPLDYYLTRQVNYLALGINILFPPFLMFLIGLMIRVPSKKNTDKILEEVIKIAYNEKPSGQQIRIKKQIDYGSFLDIVFKALYFLLFIISFGFIIYILGKLGFNWVSEIIFIVFLCLISFFGTNLRQTAKEYVVLSPTDSLSNLILDLLSLPILWLGRFLSEKLSKINFFVFFFDFIIEAPLKSIIEVIESWFGFIKEKKVEIAT